MVKWACIQRYYDNGDVTASVFSGDDLKDKYTEHAQFSEYVDVFETEEEAVQFKRETLNS